MLDKILDGRTDLVFDYIAEGYPATAADPHGVRLIRWCSYYGDVSAVKFLLLQGESLDSLGINLDLNGACFHGHWQLCQFLIERGADVNLPLQESGETPLHAAICTRRPVFNYVVKVLLANSANPSAVTKNGAETGGFMRDSRTKGETPLHRAAAFGDEAMVQMLLDAGAAPDARDMNGDSPLTWASWYLRPASILRRLCYGDFRIRPDYAGMETHLQGKAHT